MFSGRSGAARLSLIVVVGLIVIKVVVGAITGSLSVQGTDLMIREQLLWRPRLR